MIELTDEMRRTYSLAWYRVVCDEETAVRMAERDVAEPMPAREEALKAVLAIVEQDYEVIRREVVEHGLVGSEELPAVRWNPAAEEFFVDCLCGETFAAGHGGDALERALAHLDRVDNGQMREDRPEMLSDRLGYPPEVGDDDWKRTQARWEQAALDTETTLSEVGRG